MENAPDLPMLEHLLPKPKEKKVQSHHPSPENATTRHTDPSELITLREQVQSLEKQIAELRRNFEVDGFFLCNQSDRAPTHAKPLVIKPAIIKEKSQCLN
jgi:hypothetical protein